MIVGSLTGLRPWVILGAVHSVRHWKLKKDPKKLNSVDTEIWASRNLYEYSRLTERVVGGRRQKLPQKDTYIRCR